MPNAAAVPGIKNAFYNIASFPGVIGVIDGTHIPIQSPNSNIGEEFRNRKGIFSINVQVVCGHNQEIYDIVNRWPGSTHDSRIFNNSSIKLRFENQEFRGHLLGDKGYAQTSYLFTPVRNVVTPAKQRCNNSHELTRKVIERLFGIWKRRFPCLRRKMANKLVNILNIITATAVLHNISIEEHQLIDFDEEVAVDEDVDEDEDVPNPNALGDVVRSQFIHAHFH